jgi:hypothetical protein
MSLSCLLLYACLVSRDTIALLTTRCQNAFSERLAPLGYDYFSMFVVDIMHDFELGDWRALFIHLLRILDAVDSSLVVELDRRWVVYLS